MLLPNPCLKLRQKKPIQNSRYRLLFLPEMKAAILKMLLSGYRSSASILKLFLLKETLLTIPGTTYKRIRKNIRTHMVLKMINRKAKARAMRFASDLTQQAAIF